MGGGDGEMMKNNKAGKEREQEIGGRGQSRRGARMMKLENENEREMKTHNHGA